MKKKGYRFLAMILLVMAIMVPTAMQKANATAVSEISVSAVVRLQKFLTLESDITAEEARGLDANSDGKLNAVDLTLLKRQLLNLASNTTATTTKTTATTTKTTSTTTKTTATTTKTTATTTKTTATTTKTTSTTTKTTSTTTKTTSTTTKTTTTSTTTTQTTVTTATETTVFTYPAIFDEVQDPDGFMISDEEIALFLDYINIMKWEKWEFGWSEEPISGALVIPDRFYCTKPTVFVYENPKESEQDFEVLAKKYNWDLSEEYVDASWIEYMNEYFDVGRTLCWKWNDGEDPYDPEQDSVMQSEYFLYFSNVIFNWNFPLYETTNGNWQWPGFYVKNLDKPPKQ